MTTCKPSSWEEGQERLTEPVRVFEKMKRGKHGRCRQEAARTGRSSWRRQKQSSRTPPLTRTSAPRLLAGSSPGMTSPLSPPIWNLPIPQGAVQLSPSPPACQLTCAPLSSELLKRRVSPSGETQPGLFLCLLHVQNKDYKPLSTLVEGEHRVVSQ